MIFEQFLARTIHDYFDPMLKKYHFDFFQTKKSDRDIYFFYSKKDLLIEIKYNYPNEFIEIRFYKETDINKLIGADFIGLIDIWKDKDPGFTAKGYQAIMPKTIPLEKSLQILSTLLEKYGKTYLDGSEWKLWSDV